jgi:hypothetical protein
MTILGRQAPASSPGSSMSPATRTKRGRHHRGGSPVVPASPDEHDTASYAWRPRPLPAIALSIGALGIVIAQFWLETSHPVLVVFACCTSCVDSNVVYRRAALAVTGGFPLRAGGGDAVAIALGLVYLALVGRLILSGNGAA